MKRWQGVAVFLLFFCVFPQNIFGQEENPSEVKPNKRPLGLQIKEIPLGNVLIEGNRYYSTSFLKRQFGLVLKDKSLRQNNLERTLRLTNDFPDLHVNAVLFPGKELSSTDLLLQVSDDRPVHLILEANNFGNRFTGKTLITTTLTWGDLTGHGDSVLLRTIYTSPPVSDFPTWHIGYMWPIASTGAKVNFLYLKSRFVVGEDFTLLNIRGETQVYGLNMAYPLLRESGRSWDFLSGMTVKRVQSFVGDKKTNDEIRALFLGTYWKGRISDRNTIILDGNLTQGIGGKTDPDADPLVNRKNVERRAVKLTLNFMENLLVGQQRFFLLKVNGQWSGQPLLASDQFAIGGADSVRGFTQGEAVGDNGIVINGELQTRFNGQGSVLGVLFVDHGTTFLRNTQPAKTALTSAGVGLKVVRGTSLSGRLDVGIPLSPSQNVDHGTVIVTVSIVKQF